jgi:predicted protein tyrosine phosphatase
LANLLFICSKNQWRSPTAERLFKNHPQHHARSAGTSAKARVRLSQKMLDWADAVFVMEYKHREIIKNNLQLNGKTLIVLGIEDAYQFNDPELVEILKASLAEYW